jgi:3-oxoacyl-[acyl-carrier protein] reductase
MGRQFARQKTLTINSVSVGPTNTDAQKNARGKLPEAYIGAMKEYATAEKRLREPEDIADQSFPFWQVMMPNGSTVPGRFGSITSRIEDC